MKYLFLLSIFSFFSVNVSAWEGKVTRILHHTSYAAIYLEALPDKPAPGNGSCEAGAPYLLKIDETIASKQRFSLLMTALVAGKSVRGYDDGCVQAIWAQERPVIKRLYLNAN